MTETFRDLGLMETGIWMGDQASTLNFCAVAEVEGELTKPVLRAALDAAQARHPLLRARIQVSPDRLRFVGFGASELPPIPLQVVEVPFEDWVPQAEFQIQTPIDSEKGPLVRAAYLRHGPAHGTLLLGFNHVIGDGISGAYLARDVLHACASLACGGDGDLPPLGLPATIEQRLPTEFESIGGLKAAYRAFSRLRRATHILGDSPAQVAVEVQAPLSQRRSRIIPMRIEPARTKALLAACRRHGTSLHGLLGAAWCKALLPELNGQVVTFASPVNMRKRMSPAVGDDVCLFVSLVSSVHRVTAHTELWSLARSIRAKAAQAIACNWAFDFVPAMNAITARRLFFPFSERGIARHARFVMKHVSSQGTTGITNIGRLPIAARQGPLTIRATHFVVSPGVLGHLVLSAAGLADRVCLDLMHTEPLLSAGRALAIAERFQAILAQVDPDTLS